MKKKWSKAGRDWMLEIGDGFGSFYQYGRTKKAVVAKFKKNFAKDIADELARLNRYNKMVQSLR